MLHTAKTLKGYTLHSLDGEIGRVKEFYFDDHHWAIRYLVADTGNWLPGRQVLISPHAMGSISKEKEHIAIELTKKQIENCPPLDSDKPVSRQFENAYYAYYGWPMYWAGTDMWGPYPYIMRNREAPKEANERESESGLNLRSTHDVSGHHVHAVDGEIGHVEDFIIDDEMWAIRYLIIDTRNWWPGKKVLVAPQWIDHVSWSERTVFVNVSRESIKQSPEYTEGSPPTRDYETRLHGHYNRQGYWVDEGVARKESH